MSSGTLISAVLAGVLEEQRTHDSRARHFLGKELHGQSQSMPL